MFHYFKSNKGEIPYSKPGILCLQHEHVVVEELLQLLVGKVDAELLEAVELQGE